MPVREPVRVVAGRPVPTGAWTIRAVVPCLNRRRDVGLLLADLFGLDLGPQDRLSIILVDNGSDEPLSDLALPPGLTVEHLRLDTNIGGSGGFSAGLARALELGNPADESEVIWLLDSDVRLEPGSLRPLLAALDEDPGLAAVGSALIDPATGRPFEAGGRIDRRTGEFVQPLPQGWERQRTVPCEYLAACSLLVRRAAAERTGPMADLFLNGDDVEWSLRLARRVGGGEANGGMARLAAVPASRVTHPNPDRMRTIARYYAARNAFVALAAAGCGPRTRFHRAFRETGRALAMAMIGRDDLAALHLAGLADAAAGVTGKARDALRVNPWRSLSELPGALRQELATGIRGRVLLRPGLLPPADQAAATRAVNAACAGHVVEAPRPGGPLRGLLRSLSAVTLGPKWGIAVVSARSRPADWLAGRVMIAVSSEGFTLQRTGRLERALRLARVAGRGVALAVRLALTRPASPPPVHGFPPGPRPTLAVVVLSYNRRAALEATLGRLALDPPLRGAHVLVADNGSTDGTESHIRAAFPGVEVLAFPDNRGVSAFNNAVAQTHADAVLILDDDASPAPGVLDAALDLMARRPDLGAVALHPRHPGTGQSEWPFAGDASRDDWPVMGCGNLVRRHAWDRVGGYEGEFFLYRNDTDLAMKLLGAGFGVHFNPAWVVLHDSPAAAGKPARWFETATRNWVWLCRRHGRGLSKAGAIALGWLWAHRLARFDPIRHWRALRGAAAGLFTPPPPLPPGLLVDGAPVRRLLRLRLAR